MVVNQLKVHPLSKVLVFRCVVQPAPPYIKARRKGRLLKQLLAADEAEAKSAGNPGLLAESVAGADDPATLSWYLTRRLPLEVWRCKLDPGLKAPPGFTL